MSETDEPGRQFKRNYKNSHLFVKETISCDFFSLWLFGLCAKGFAFDLLWFSNCSSSLQRNQRKTEKKLELSNSNWKSFKCISILFKIELSNRKTFLVASRIRTPNLSISIWLRHTNQLSHSALHRHLGQTIMLHNSIGRATWWSRKNRELNLSVTLFSLYDLLLFLLCH